ncbi:transglutaminase domain-containing protein [Candidatus Omnitrophota bacterium]
MKKTYFLIKIALLVVVILVLNVDVTTRKGINFEVRTVKIPLYLKALNFFDRHYNYKHLVRQILDKNDPAEERVMKIFNWTLENIREVPPGFPIVDNHVWTIIVRGCGACDQSHDVFTTLCNYAGIRSYYAWVDSADGKKRYPFSFVKLQKRWCILDPCGGVYFKNNREGLADLNEMQCGNFSVVKLKEDQELSYTAYLGNLKSTQYPGMNRANVQSPLNRLFYWLGAMGKKLK